MTTSNRTIFVSEAQPASSYPFDFHEAVLPDEVYVPLCDHPDGGPHDTHCVHDWRIHWGNVDKTGEV